jgi:hypothetical protein
MRDRHDICIFVKGSGLSAEGLIVVGLCGFLVAEYAVADIAVHGIA